MPDPIGENAVLEVQIDALPFTVVTPSWVRSGIVMLSYLRLLCGEPPPLLQPAPFFLTPTTEMLGLIQQLRDAV
jgi:hypothetical protein